MPHLYLPNEEPTSTTAIHDCSTTRAIPLKRPMPWSVALRIMILTHAPWRTIHPTAASKMQPTLQRELRTIISVTASPHLSCGNRASILHKWDTRAQREAVTYPRSRRLISLSRPNPKHASGLGLGWTGQRPPWAEGGLCTGGGALTPAAMNALLVYCSSTEGLPKQ